MFYDELGQNYGNPVKSEETAGIYGGIKKRAIPYGMALSLLDA
jgi:hypothetical protein